jgi:hypothetical protein
MVVLGSFETPDVRLMRLRTQLGSTTQSMEDTVADAIDLEDRRRAMEESLRLFREVEQRQQPPAFQPLPRIPVEARPTPESTAIRRGRVFPDPALSGTEVGDRQQQIAFRYVELLEETRRSFPTRTPPGTTVESLALERLEEEFGEELRAAQPQERKGLFGKLLSAGLRGTEALVLGRPGAGKEALEDIGTGIQFLETEPTGGILGGPFRRDPRTGKTTFETGAEISRPVVQAAQPIVAEPFAQVEAAGIPGVSPAAGGVATAIQSQIVEDIATEIINPAALVLIAPVALQAASGLRGAAAAEVLISNLLATGLEPQLVRGTLRGLTVLSRRGLAGVAELSRAVRETPIIQDAIRGISEVGEAGGGPLRGGGAIENIGDATRVWWDSLSTAERKAAIERTSGGLARFVPKKHDRSYIRILKSGRGNINIVDDAFNTAGRPGFDLQAIRRPRPLTPEEVAFGPQETAVSARTPGELQELDEFGRARFAGEETAPGPLRGGEVGGGKLEGLVDIKDFFGRLIDPILPQGGIPGGFKARPKGMRPGARVTGLSQEGEQIEGTLIQVVGEKAIIRDASGTVRPVTAPELVEAAERIGITTRLKDIGRDFRFGPSSRTAIPSLDPSVQKFVKVLRTAKPTQRTLKAERAEELGRRAARGRVPFEAEARTPEEALKGLRTAQRGKLPEPPEFEVTLIPGEFPSVEAANRALATGKIKGKPITAKQRGLFEAIARGDVEPTERVTGVVAEAFTQEEVTNFINIARFSPALDRELFTRGNIIESLIGSLEKKGILFGRLPTPGELKNLERVYGPEFARELQKLRPFGERFWRLTLDALNIPRSFLAAFDLSFPFRQGVFAFARHPKEFFGNLPAMLRAAKNPDFAEQMVAAIKNDRTLIETAEGFRPLNELMEESKLFLPDISGTEAFEARAEEFLSTLAHRIPGVGFSERGFIAYGDKLRADIFRNTLQSWARQAKPATADEIADLGILFNVLTGRGNLPPELAKSLSFGFFAPRFAASRPQLFLAATVNNLPGARRVTGTVLGVPGQTTRVARLATQELVTSVGAGLTILALVKMSGAGDVELNPLSSDFGKIKIGKTRIDFWGGARPWATVIARMITGKRKTATGFVVPQSTLDTLVGFGRSKLAPPAALLIDVSVGETAIGEEVGTAGDILNRTLPLAIQDIKDAVEQEGATIGLLSTAAFLGVGFQTYETPGEKKKRAFEETFPDRTYQATPDDNRLVRGAIEEDNNKAALEDAFQPSPEQMETEEVRIAQATELGLFSLAHGVEALRGLSAEAILTGNNDAGLEFADVWIDYLDRVSGAIFEAVFGKEKRGSPEYLAWRDIKLRRDPTTFEPLWDEFFAEKDAAFKKLDPRLQRALDLVDAPGDDPVLQRAVEDFGAARKKRRELFDIPRWTGIGATEQKQIEDVHDLVERKRTQFAFQGLSDVPAEDIYRLVGQENGIAGDVLQMAFLVRPGSTGASQLRNPKYDETLLTSTEVLLPFFPDMFRRREIQAQLGAPQESSRIPVPTTTLESSRIPVPTTEIQSSRIPVP